MSYNRHRRPGESSASRLEGLNKHYGTSIIASERIVESARGHFAFRLLDCVAVKGKKAGAIKIYELLGPIEQAGVHSKNRRSL